VAVITLRAKTQCIAQKAKDGARTIDEIPETGMPRADKAPDDPGGDKPQDDIAAGNMDLLDLAADSEILELRF